VRKHAASYSSEIRCIKLSKRLSRSLGDSFAIFASFVAVEEYLYSGFFLVVIVIAIKLMGDFLRDVFNQRLYKG
jgi:ABC-type dipeptide/oligopeptide/nickel transport system permease subunit